MDVIRNVFEFNGRLHRSQQHVRPDVPHDKVDFVGLDQLIGLLLADLRLEAVVFVYDLYGQATHFAAHMIERQLERVAHVVADDGNGPAEGADEPDFDRFVLGRHRTRCKQHGRARS